MARALLRCYGVGMTNSAQTTTSTVTIRPDEAAHFGQLAAEWWDPKGSSAMLHRLNPARLGYIRDAINSHWHAEPEQRQPLSGLRAIDVGCGAGLLCEPLARLGAAVTGVDAAAENVGVAAAHAQAMGLTIDYRHGDIGDAAFADTLGQFNLVTSMEVIEHVADPAAFLTSLAARLADGGLMVLSTPNRTLASKVLLVEAAERIGSVPRGTHHWDQFLTPDELTALAQEAGLHVVDVSGLSPDFSTRGFRAGGSTQLDYLVTLIRA